MKVPHPIPYQGSKRRLAPFIVERLPSDTERIVEPFAGSAAISLASACERRTSTFLLNDFNAPLMDLWRAILEDSEGLAEGYKRLWDSQQGREREFYDEVRDEFNRTPRPDLFLYLLARCVKASVRYNANGEFNQSPDNRRQGARPSTMRRHIMGASQLLAGRTEVTAGDYRETLAAVTPRDTVYMDPPYQGVCNNRDSRYLSGVTFEEFVAALEDLNRRGISYIVSYDGRTGDKEFGRLLPTELELLHLEIDAGRSTQATLLGVEATTYESLYLSPALVQRLGNRAPKKESATAVQPTLFGE